MTTELFYKISEEIIYSKKQNKYKVKDIVNCIKTLKNEYFCVSFFYDNNIFSCVLFDVFKTNEEMESHKDKDKKLLESNYGWIFKKYYSDGSSSTQSL